MRGKHRKKPKTCTRRKQPKISDDDANTAELPVDRLSSLPDGIIVDIFSLIPTKTAVSTSVLSRRYRHLWTEITSIHLDSRHFPQLSVDIHTVVDHLLTQLTSPLLRSFFFYALDLQPHYLESWLRFLCSRNVQDIEFKVEPRPKAKGGGGGSYLPVIILPHCVFRTPSLVSLDLPMRHVNYELPDDNDHNFIINLPRLKRLRLSIYGSQCGSVSKLVRSCPSLERLYLRAEKSSTKDGEIDDNNGALIALHTVVVFTDTLALTRSYMLPLISNVKLLHIGNLTMMDYLPDCHGYPSINCEPYSLVLRWVNESVDDVKSFLLKSTSSTLLGPVKKMKIMVSNFKFTKNLNKLVKYLLSNYLCLEKLAVVVETKSDERGFGDKLEEMLFCVDLYKCSRKFRRCHIEFCGWFVKLPTNSAELQVLENQIGEFQSAFV